MATTAYKIAVVGNHDAILPFQMLGFDLYPIQSSEQVGQTLAQLSQNGYGIVYLTEDFAQEVPEIIAYYHTQITPAVILIPTHQGSLGIGKKQIELNVEKAVGQNIL